MSNTQILRSATIVGATAIGHARDLGSLETGKLADLQILDKNPLDDIKNTTSIRYVMKNGRLYQTADLTEIWPRRKPLPPIYLWPDSVAVDSTQADSAIRAWSPASRARASARAGELNGSRDECETVGDNHASLSSTSSSITRISALSAPSLAREATPNSGAARCR